MDRRTTFNRRPNTDGEHGHIYEKRLVMYALLQCEIAVKGKRISKFKLAANLDRVGALDDIVLVYEYVGSTKTKTIFVQAKHKLGTSSEALTIHTLLSGADNVLSLKKYFDSHWIIGGRFRHTDDGKNLLPSNGDCTYVICSNRELVTAYGGFKEVSEDEPIDLFTCKKCTKPNVPHSHTFHKLAYRTYRTYRGWISREEKLFLSRLRLHFAQLDEKQLDDAIKIKIKSHWPNASVQFIFADVYYQIANWSRRENYFLTEADDLFEQSHRRLEALSKPPWLDNALKLLSFREESLTELKNALAQGSRAVSVLVPTGRNVLGVVKTLQTVGDDHFFWNVSDDRSVDDAVLDMFETDFKHLILNVNAANMPAHTLDKLFKILRNNSKFVVFVMPSDFVGLRESLHVKFLSEYREIVDDKVNFSDLEDESKLKINTHKVVFQGDTTHVGRISWNDSHTSHILVSAVEDKPIVIGKSVKKSNDTYVDRRLEKVVLKKECLLDSTLTLAISGWEDAKEVDSNFMNGTNKILIPRYKNFDRVCSFCEEIHWLDIKEEKLLWMKSKGAIKDLRRYVSESPSAIDWQEIVENFNKLTIISAKPGMGKSTLFDAISEKVLRHREKMVWKIRIDLIYIKKEIKEMKRENVFDFLRDHMELETQMEVDSFRHYFNEGKILVMLDGYDEVSAELRNEVDRMIEIFAKHDSLSVIIATRTRETARLEDKFHTFAYGLTKFSTEDGILFLGKFFRFHSKTHKEYDDKSLYDKIKAGVGMPLVENPLYLRIAVEHFADKDHTIKKPPRNILEMYRYFFDEKFEIYWKGFQKNLPKRKHMSDMDANHRIMALGGLFENNHPRLLFENEEEALLDEEVRQQCLEMGIVRGFAGDEAVFVHRTYAEYFAAMWLAEMCADEHRIGRLRDFLKAIRFYDDRHERLRNFFDWAVVEMGDDERSRSLPCHEAVLQKDWKALKEHFADRDQRDKCGRTPLHLAVTCDKYDIGIINVLVERGADRAVEDLILRWRPLCYAIYFGHTGPISLLAALESYDRVFEAAERVRQDVAIDEERRLSIAYKAMSCWADHTAIVDAMIDDGEEALANKLIEGTTLLHVAVKYGSACTAKLLLTRKDADPTKTDEDGKSALERARARNEGDETRLLFE